MRELRPLDGSHFHVCSQAIFITEVHSPHTCSYIQGPTGVQDPIDTKPTRDHSFDPMATRPHTGSQRFKALPPAPKRVGGTNLDFQLEGSRASSMLLISRILQNLIEKIKVRASSTRECLHKHFRAVTRTRYQKRLHRHKPY